MKRNWFLRWYVSLCMFLLYVMIGLSIALFGVIVVSFPPVVITLTLLGVYAVVSFLIWLVEREFEKCPADAWEDRALLMLHLGALVVLGGIAVGFFRLMFESMERRGFGIWEMVGVSFAGVLLGLLLVLRRRRNNKKP